MEYKKVKSTAKVVTPKGPQLTSLVKETLEVISSIVGATLGPGGRSVLIERYEHNLPPIVTKDGITCFRALGFLDATRHTIMETARDSASRTASEAGDGTITATVLAEAIVRNVDKYCMNNPKISPQRVIRILEKYFSETIEPSIRQSSIQVDVSTQEGKSLLWGVAKISANGDERLADAVMKCYDITGDEGNVTIIEESGPSGYCVEEIKGFGISIGYEETCGRLWSKFVNDAGTSRCLMDRPVFAVYNGKITETQTIQLFMEKIGNAWASGAYNHHNVVLVANGFSESVLGELAVNFSLANTINVYPLTAPQSPSPGGQEGFLEDVCAITGAILFDPLNRTFDQGEFQDLGPGVELFEASRYRSNIVGHAEGPLFSGYDGTGKAIYTDNGTYEDGILLRIDELQSQIESAASQLDRLLLEERVAKLSGGIARLKVIGASNGETKEKRDRAEDAVCGVRGAIKHGCLPGGGWMLMKLSSDHPDCLVRPIIETVLFPSLQEPVRLLLLNAGLTTEEVLGIIESYKDNFLNVSSNSMLAYDCLKHSWINPIEEGLLDSTPAVLEAVRNSLSIASLLGTIGGTIVFPRDGELERVEARDTQDFIRNANVNEANLRP